MTSLLNFKIAKIELTVELLLWDHSALFEFKRPKVDAPLLIIMERCLYGNLSGEEEQRLKFIRDLANDQREIIYWRSGLSMIM